MIAASLSQRIAEAMKAHDGVRLSTLRLLSSAFNYERIEKQHELTQEEEIAVVRREAKKRKDAIEAYGRVADKGDVVSRVAKEKEELAILQEFLPAEMSDEELTKIVEEAIAQTNAAAISDMGRVIGVVMGKTKGNVEGGRVSAIVKAKLGQ